MPQIRNPEKMNCWQLISLQADGLFRTKLYAQIFRLGFFHSAVSVNFISSGQIKASESKSVSGAILDLQDGI